MLFQAIILQAVLSMNKEQEKPSYFTHTYGLIPVRWALHGPRIGFTAVVAGQQPHSFGRKWG